MVCDAGGGKGWGWGGCGMTHRPVLGEAKQVYGREDTKPRVYSCVVIYDLLYCFPYEQLQTCFAPPGVSFLGLPFTGNHGLGGFNNGHASSPSPGGREARRPDRGAGCEESRSPSLPPGFCGSGPPWRPLACGHIVPISASFITWRSFFLCACLCVQMSPFKSIQSYYVRV